MKINYIKISNILSFKYYDNFQRCPKINFYDKESANDKINLNVLIGPNGSGKSNFLEVLNQLFEKTLFKDFSFQDGSFLSQVGNKKKNTFQSQTETINNLDVNWNSSNKKQEIELSLSLNENDFNNINLVIDKSQEIDEYIATYSNENFSLSSLITENVNDFKKQIKDHNELQITFTRDDSNQDKKFNARPGQGTNDFILKYLEYFRLLQKIIELHNTRIKTSKAPAWNNLKNTFALISCYRNYNNIRDSYSIDQNLDEEERRIYSLRKNSDTINATNEEPLVFQLFKKEKFFYAINRSKTIGQEKAAKEIEKGLEKNINKYLNDFLNIKAKINFSSDQRDQAKAKLDLYFKEKNRKIDFKNLSSGQKGMVHLIFALHGYDIEHGLIIIDEPEIHLHPQLQNDYLKIMEKESKERDIQFIIATHSPIFIDQTDFCGKKIFHFKKNGNKKIVEYTQQDNPFKILDDLGVKASQILQTNGVVWVEGITDKIYIKKWLQLFCEENKYPPPIEGSHYSFLEFGGRNLSHLSLDKNIKDENLETLMPIIKNNRNNFIVIDSDKNKEEDDINDTKKRITNECKAHWITKGKEIENYLPKDVLGFNIEKFESISKIYEEQERKKLTKKEFALEKAEALNKDNWKTHDLETMIKVLHENIIKWNK